MKTKYTITDLYEILHTFFHFLISLFIEMIIKLLPSITTISLLGSITLQHLSCVGSECNRHYVCAVNHCNYHNAHPRLHYQNALSPQFCLQ